MLQPRHKLALAAALAAACLLAQQAAPVIRVDVNLVRVVATVKNNAGDLVGTLAKDDFELYDNGRRQQLAVFEHHTEQPLSVSLLIDTSGSTAKDLKYETDSMSKFLRALFAEGNPADAVALYSFNWVVTRQNWFTHNHASVERSLKLLKAEAGTAMYDAIYLACRDLEDRDGRHVMIVVTDGGDTTSSKDFHAALEAAQMADAVIYPVLVMPITNDAGRNIGGENALTTIAAGTGGRVFAPSVGPDLDAAFAEIIRDLRTQYLLGYYPKDVPLTASRFHKLEVRLRQPGLRVSARNGYYGDAEGDAGSGCRQDLRGPSRKKAGEIDTPNKGGKAGTRAPEQTFEEVKYLKQLIETRVPVRLKLADGEEVSGVVEYYDQSFIRITREGAPNLFIYKHDIKYLVEEGS